MSLQKIYTIINKIAKYPPIDRAGWDGNRCAYCQVDVGYRDHELGKHSEKCLWQELREAMGMV